MIFAFEHHRLDVDRRELRRDGELIDLQPQVFDLLVYLVRQRHRVVSKADLLESVWQGRIVSDSALAARINAARRALADDGTHQRLIRTLARKGFRFMGNVTPMPAQTSRSPRRTARDPSTSPDIADVPSIAVAPFTNLGGDGGLDKLAAGLVEEIGVCLSRIRWLATVDGEPGARYVLRGTIRRAGDTIRVATRLTEARTGTYLWADHFNGSPEAVLEFQDGVASRICGVIEPVLQAFEAERVAHRPLGDLGAYETYLRAFAMVFASARRIPAALGLLQKLIASEPDDGTALALAANYHMRLCMDGVSADPVADTQRGADYARRALRVASDDPGVLANAARPLAYAGDDIDTTIALMDRALAINPSFARGWYIRGFLKYWAGDLDTSIEEVETALRLSPHGRFGTPLTAIGNALVFAERFNEAIPMLRLAIQQDPGFPPNHRLLAICHAYLGQRNEARAALARLPDTAPVSIPNLTRSYRAMVRNSGHLELALSGLRLATGLSKRT